MNSHTHGPGYEGVIINVFVFLVSLFDWGQLETITESILKILLLAVTTSYTLWRWNRELKEKKDLPEIEDLPDELS